PAQGIFPLHLMFVTARGVRSRTPAPQRVAAASLSGPLISLSTRRTPGTLAAISTARGWSVMFFTSPPRSTTPLLTDWTRTSDAPIVGSALSAFATRSFTWLSAASTALARGSGTTCRRFFMLFTPAMPFHGRLRLRLLGVRIDLAVKRNVPGVRVDIDPGASHPFCREQRDL